MTLISSKCRNRLLKTVSTPRKDPVVTTAWVKDNDFYKGLIDWEFKGIV